VIKLPIAPAASDPTPPIVVAGCDGAASGSRAVVDESLRLVKAGTGEIDFESVGAVSLSFADELFAKLRAG
jgi:hypothetical protein